MNPTDVAERLGARLVTNAKTGCVEWMGGVDGGGYGCISVMGRMQRTHRVAWLLRNGPIPDGLFVLHRCDNPPCSNPDHLFLGTQADNMLDRSAKRRHANQAKTHCPQGHPYEDGNTYLSRRGDRRCRQCHRKREAARRASRKETPDA